MKIYQFFVRNMSLPMGTIIAETKDKAIKLFEKEYGVSFKSTTVFREKLYRVKELKIEGYRIVEIEGANNIEEVE